jgi:S-adenosyl methyltransferase
MQEGDHDDEKATTRVTDQGMGEQGHPPDQIDTSRPHPARMYDYYLGGQDNYEVDREAAEQVLALLPDLRPTARENRVFLRRATRSVVGDGIRQIIDIGTGIPTAPNTHDAARSVTPDVRVAYVDNDPIVGVYAEAKLTNRHEAGFALADLRDPKAVLEHPAVAGLIDFDQPVALLLVAVLHFIRDDEDPAGIVAALAEALPAGSRLVLSHGTQDFHDREQIREAAEVYKNATARVTPRPHAEVMSFFDGFELVDPGLVQLPLWRPDGAVPAPDELRRIAFYGGVGVKS